MMKAEDIINLLGLQPHPEEGGYFAETYKCEEGIPRKALPDRYYSRNLAEKCHDQLIPVI